MSYSFSWDCTLPINNIQDIISINIVPETKTHNEGNYVSLKGHICIEGEYVVHSEEQHHFDEKIPLDITLPNNGQVEEIVTEVTNFDYEIKSGKMLFLKVDLILLGYELELKTQIPAAEAYEMIKEELDYNDLEELVLDVPIETIDLTETTSITKEACDFLDKRKEHAPENEVSKAIKQVEPAHTIETIVDGVSGVAENVTNMIETAKDKVENIVELIKPTPIIETDIKAVEEVEDEKELVKSYKAKKLHKAVDNGEEVMPFPIKSGVSKEGENINTDKKVNLFDMLYTLESKPGNETGHLSNNEIVSKKSLKQHEHKVVKEEVEKISLENKLSFFDEGIASQFADGASVIKVIFIQEELTIASMCEKYQIPEHAICNLEALVCPLQFGDRVMINYGRVQ